MNVFQETIIDFLQNTKFQEEILCLIGEDLDGERALIFSFDYCSYAKCQNDDEACMMSMRATKVLREICSTVRKREVEWEINAVSNDRDIEIYYEPVADTDTPAEYYFAVTERGEKHSIWSHAFSIQPCGDFVRVEEYKGGKAVLVRDVSEKEALRLFKDYLSLAIA